MVKVSLDLDVSLHKEIRKKAIDKGITMKVYLIELIERGYGMEEENSIEEGNSIEEENSIEEGRDTKDSEV